LDDDHLQSWIFMDYLPFHPRGRRHGALLLFALLSRQVPEKFGLAGAAVAIARAASTVVIMRHFKAQPSIGRHLTTCGAKKERHARSSVARRQSANCSVRILESLMSLRFLAGSESIVARDREGEGPDLPIRPYQSGR
jgi:hypothetical protein